MQTHFSQSQLTDPSLAEAEGILHKCVHCGFCLASCPTYVLNGDERDSPRGRIYMIKDMLEGDKAASATVTRHIDRCLSCLGCMTSCPSDVDYMHLVDLARRRIEETYRRPWADSLLRAFLARLLPRAGALRLALAAARCLRVLRRWMPGRVRTLLEMTPKAAASSEGDVAPGVYPAQGKKKMRVALLTGCVQKVLRPSINAASLRLLNRHGAEVVVVPGGGCCGALAHHLGRAREAITYARANIAAWAGEIESTGLDAVVVNASGCGTMVKDYGHLLRADPAWAQAAALVSERARDISQIIDTLGLRQPTHGSVKTVAHLSACSLQHGQNIHAQPAALLKAAGFTVVEPAEGELCCGSAGTYNLLQPGFATRLGARKAEHLEKCGADIVAAGNIGCLVQMAAYMDTPVVHTAELLDWATGGPPPPELAG